MFFSIPHAAVGLGGEELEGLAAHVHGLLHLACGGGAGHGQAALVNDILGDVGIEAGSDDEGGARIDGAVHLLLGQHGAGAQQHLGHLLVDQADALLGAGGAEGDLGGGQAAVRQGLAQGQGLVHAVEGDDGDNADLVNTLQGRIRKHKRILLYFQACAV